MFNFNLKSFFLFLLVFIICVPIGKLHHESGHYLAGKAVGINSRINYMSTIYTNSRSYYKEYFDLYDKNRDAIENGRDFKDKLVLEKLKWHHSLNSFIFTLGGPLITILTGTIAFILLLRLYKKEKVLSPLHYILVFLSLLWLRAPANLFTGLYYQINTGHLSRRGDEVKLSTYFYLNSQFFDLLLGGIGFLIGCIIIFKIIPLQHRLSFILAGLIGGNWAFYFWMYQIGPIVLP